MFDICRPRTTEGRNVKTKAECGGAQWTRSVVKSDPIGSNLGINEDQSDQTVSDHTLRFPNTETVAIPDSLFQALRKISFTFHFYVALLPKRGRILRRTLSVCLSVPLS